jgi:predicted dinucleotide-binding enzyme
MALIEQSGQDKQQMLTTLGKLAEGLIPAARNAAAPIGETCTTVTVSQDDEALVVWDESDKRAISERIQPAIQPRQVFTIYISELDVVAGTARFSFSQDEQRRFRAKIADPVVVQPHNPYTRALDEQSALNVIAKAEILDGEIVQLHVSDTAPDE